MGVVGMSDAERQETDSSPQGAHEVTDGSPAKSHRPLIFPDVPRLELDQLLEQLVARAQEVITTQGRLRGLLKAHQVINGDLGLKALLRRIVEASRETWSTM
jgi:hypothetical protein